MSLPVAALPLNLVLAAVAVAAEEVLMTGRGSTDCVVLEILLTTLILSALLVTIESLAGESVMLLSVPALVFLTVTVALQI